MRKLSSGPIQNEVLTINSEHPYSEYPFERKSQTKFHSSDQSFEKQEEEFIEFKEEHHDELRNFSSGPIQNEFLTLISEHPSSENHFERKLQANISPSEKSLEKQ